MRTPKYKPMSFIIGTFGRNWNRNGIAFSFPHFVKPSIHAGCTQNGYTQTQRQHTFRQDIPFWNIWTIFQWNCADSMMVYVCRVPSIFFFFIKRIPFTNWVAQKVFYRKKWRKKATYMNVCLCIYCTRLSFKLNEMKMCKLCITKCAPERCWM